MSVPTTDAINICAGDRHGTDCNDNELDSYCVRNTVSESDMVVCVCRNIRTSDYPDPQALRERLMQADHQCGRCRGFYDSQPPVQEQTCSQQSTLCNTL